MSRSLAWPGAIAAVALATLAVGADAGEMSFKSVPKAVQETVLARFKGARVVGASSERGTDRKLVYEISLSENGKNIDATLTPGGALITIEKEVTLADFPEAVIKVLDRKYPGARYGIVENVYKVKDGKETLAYYEARLVDAHKQAWALEIAPDGTILNTEKKKGLGEDAD